MTNSVRADSIAPICHCACEGVWGTHTHPNGNHHTAQAGQARGWFETKGSADSQRIATHKLQELARTPAQGLAARPGPTPRGVGSTTTCAPSS